MTDQRRRSLSFLAGNCLDGDLLAEGGRKILRKKKRKPDLADFQEMLGVSVPILKEILDALGIENG
jgi:hypothetical protein